MLRDFSGKSPRLRKGLTLNTGQLYVRQFSTQLWLVVSSTIWFKQMNCRGVLIFRTNWTQATWALYKLITLHPSFSDSLNSLNVLPWSYSVNQYFRWMTQYCVYGWVSIDTVQSYFNNKDIRTASTETRQFKQVANWGESVKVVVTTVDQTKSDHTENLRTFLLMFWNVQFLIVVFLKSTWVHGGHSTTISCSSRPSSQPPVLDISSPTSLGNLTSR